jgi:hypothetical protein
MSWLSIRVGVRQLPAGIRWRTLSMRRRFGINVRFLNQYQLEAVLPEAKRTLLGTEEVSIKVSAGYGAYAQGEILKALSVAPLTASIRMTRYCIPGTGCG